jgi:2-iminobutanoate/2-iminopropanoate deaminase
MRQRTKEGEQRWKKTVVHVPGMSEATRERKVPLSPAIKANGFVFVSGMPPIDPATGQIPRADIVRQTELSLENVKRALEAAGSSLDKAVMVKVFCANAAHYAAINEVYARYFTKDPPARTFVPVAGWPLPFDIEIECIALE